MFAFFCAVVVPIAALQLSLQNFMHHYACDKNETDHQVVQMFFFVQVTAQITEFLSENKFHPSVILVMIEAIYSVAHFLTPPPPAIAA